MMLKTKARKVLPDNDQTAILQPIRSELMSGKRDNVPDVFSAALHRRDPSLSQATETVPNNDNDVTNFGHSNAFLQMGRDNRARNRGNLNHISQISSEAIIGICLVFLGLLVVKVLL